ncbi:MAG TPA: 1-(5-phosphoribosyl)-5-[(5-phosphoribosylamino)methylideneamino]imidazole-4-carboxamide isomerase [Acidisphaera sp.]|nr:1-(5-phosphoribosyl)-5-[(5-phosphoribosylamino)methylideneamino]imidazole-4-carboxamide isomerase [Acidisphaera sp.]
MPLTIYPAIDLKDGACVRLRQGAMDSATVYGNDPAAQARAWADAGFTWLHVVDLNGAFAGRSVNADAVCAILGEIDIPVQLGGGIRDIDAVASWLEAGVARVILGSAAVKKPALVFEAGRAFPGRIVVGIDARDGRVATEGWADVSDLDAADLARRFEQAGIAAVIYTDIGRDGMLGGINLAQTVALAERVSVPVIASGGVGSVADIAAVRDAAAQSSGQIQGVIVGRALYDGYVTPAEALAAA